MKMSGFFRKSWPVLVFLVLAAAGCPQAAEGRFTILLTTTSGPNHIHDAGRLKKSLSRSGWEGVYVITKADYSEIFWGKYKTLKDTREHLRKARRHKNRLGHRPFDKAMPSPIPGKDIGPPKWNLRNARGVYTVVMAVYFDIPQEDYFGRKQSAIELCRKYRDMGYEAYFYHGSVRSHVTIGTFDESAVKIVRYGKLMDMGMNVKHVIRDKRIHAIIKRFPQYSKNGNADVVYTFGKKMPGTNLRRKIRTVRKPFTARIPRKKDKHGLSENVGPGNRQPRQTPGDSPDSWESGRPRHRIRGF